MPPFMFQDALYRRAPHDISEPAAQSDRDRPIPLDIYKEDDQVVIEGAIPGARLEDLELSCEEGVLVIRAEIEAQGRNYAVREIPRGSFSRTVALPTQCAVDEAKASYENGILRIKLPQSSLSTRRTIKVEVGGEAGESSRIVMEQNQPGETIDAVKGEGYQEVERKSPKKRPRNSK